MIDKLSIFLNELSEKESENFIAACSAAERGLIGVPRIVLKKESNISFEDLNNLYLQNFDFYKINDKKYDKIIKGKDLQSFLSILEYDIVFDLCQISFLNDDELFKKLNNDLKKLFSLNIRNVEKNKFSLKAKDHLHNQNSITSKVILNKLNEIWVQKWSHSNSYLNDFNDEIINNILNA